MGSYLSVARPSFYETKEFSPDTTAGAERNGFSTEPQPPLHSNAQQGAREAEGLILGDCIEDGEGLRAWDLERNHENILRVARGSV